MVVRQSVPTVSRGEDHPGEKTLLWQCGVCGELGSIDAIPTSCPSCGASSEWIEYATED